MTRHHKQPPSFNSMDEKKPMIHIAGVAQPGDLVTRVMQIRCTLHMLEILAGFPVVWLKACVAIWMQAAWLADR